MVWHETCPYRRWREQPFHRSKPTHHLSVLAIYCQACCCAITGIDNSLRNNEVESHDTRQTYALWAILAAAVFLRLYLGLTTTYLWDEDRDWIPVAQSISLSPSSIHLPLRASFHGSLSAYFMAAGSLLFGPTAIGFRFVGLLAGVATVYLVYATVKLHFGRTGGLWAAGLLAVNEFHVQASILAIQQTYFLSFAALTIYLVTRAFDRDEPRTVYWASLSAGLAYLAYEIAILMLPAFALALLWSSTHRKWLLRREPYLGVLIFMVVISPDVLSNLTAPVVEGAAANADHLNRIGGLGFTKHYLRFFAGDFVQWVYDVTGRELFHPGWNPTRFRHPNQEYVTMNTGLGVVLLGACAYGLTQMRQLRASERWWLALFWFVLLFFTLVRPGQSPGLDPVAWWWVSILVIPGSVVAGRYLATMPARFRLPAYGWVGISVALALFRILVGQLEMQSSKMTFDPTIVVSPDSGFVSVIPRFAVSLGVGTVRHVEMESVEYTSLPGRAEDTPAVRGVDYQVTVEPGARPTLSVRATGDRWYWVRYRVTGTLGTATARGLVISDESAVPWPTQSWTDAVRVSPSGVRWAH